MKTIPADAGATRADHEALFLRWVHQIPDPASVNDPYLNAGSSLYAILLTQAYSITSDENYLTDAVAHLERAAHLLERLPLNSSLYRGICGFAWALQSFPQPERISRIDETLNDLDDLLADALEVSRNYHIDIISGLAGVTIYALSRTNHSPAAERLWLVLDELHAAFLTNWMDADLDTLPEEGTSRNLGVAHGVPGLLAVASVAAIRKRLSNETSGLVRASLDRVWELVGGPAQRSHLPSRVGDSTPARLAWCYGGLGLAATFRNAIALDDSNLARLQHMARCCLSQYRSNHHRIVDASLCHGHAGAALTFQHISRTPGLDKELALELCRISQQSAAAILASEANRNGQSVFLHWSRNRQIPSHTFLEGGAGIALTSAALASERTPQWMNLLAYY